MKFYENFKCQRANKGPKKSHIKITHLKENPEKTIKVSFLQLLNRNLLLYERMKLNFMG